LGQIWGLIESLDLSFSEFVKNVNKAHVMIFLLMFVNYVYLC
jgi:hypothetical protein